MSKPNNRHTPTRSDAPTIYCAHDKLVPLADLKPHPRNPNKHPAEQLRLFGKIIRANGWRRPIVVSNLSGCIIKGHGAWLAAKAEKWAGAPVNFQDYPSAEAELQDLLADNELARLANNDEKELEKLLADLDGTDLELAGILSKLEHEATPAPAADLDHIEDLAKKWKTAVGQTWSIGRHEIICGPLEKVLIAMPDNSIDLIFTDPPYGHKNNDGDLIHNREKALGKKPRASSKARPIANDDAENTARVFGEFLTHAKRLLKPGCCCCCCCGGGGGPDPQFARWSLELDKAIGFKHAVVWDKGGLGMGWHYRRCYEFVLVAEKPGAACHWFGGNDVPNVIRDIGKIIPGATEHPTEKPIELVEWFLRLQSAEKDLVLDPFAGSGSTLMACERLGRVGRRR